MKPCASSWDELVTVSVVLPLPGGWRRRTLVGVDVGMSTRDPILTGLPDAVLLEAIQKALQQVGQYVS